MFYHFCRSSFRNNVRHTAGLPLARMGFHSDLFRRGRFRSIRIGFGFIEGKGKLVHQFFPDPLRGRTKLALLCKAKLLQKPLVLELQLSQLCLLRFIFRA